MRLFIALMISLLSNNAVIGQEEKEFIAKSLSANDITKILPSIDSLTRLAYKNSPDLQYQRADQRYWKARQRLAQTRWLDYFYVEGTYSYGIFDNLTEQQLTGVPTASQTLLSTQQSRYTFGPSLKIPISAILNRGNDIRAAKAERERSMEEREVEKAKIREVVIVRYSEIVKSHRLIFIYSTMVDTYKVQSLRAEADYKNGIIEVAEYTRLQQMYNEAMVAFESEKSHLALAILLLEQVVGIKLMI